MGRAKIAMEPITNHKKRKITFNSRSNSLIKKARELAILCDVNVSIIIFTQDKETPQIFPPDHDKLHSLIDVINCNPESINRYTLSDYYKNRKMKIEEQLIKAKKNNLAAKFPSWFDFLDNFSEAGLRELALGLENKILDVQARIEFLKNINVEYPVGLYNNNPMIMKQSWNPIMIMPSDSSMMLYPDHSMLNEYDNHVVNDPLMEKYCSPPHQSWQQQFVMSGTFQ